MDKGTQILLTLQYQQLLREGFPLPPLRDIEFANFSQNGEDGILLFLFAVLGTTDRKVVEICAGDGIECMAANLIVNHGWDGLLFDGSETNVTAGRRFYQDRSAGLRINPPRFVRDWVTAENVNQLVSGCGVTGEIDLLAFDLDGMDYWVWTALEAVQPRVVVAEFNRSLGAMERLTLPYSADYVHDWSYGYPQSPSLAAMAQVGRQKDYRLVGCDRYGINAFFIRNDVGIDLLPEVAPEDCLPPSEARGPAPAALIRV